MNDLIVCVDGIKWLYLRISIIINNNSFHYNDLIVYYMYMQLGSY